MDYIVRQGLQSSPRIKAMAIANGDDPAKTIAINHAFFEYSHQVLEKYPEKPYKSFRELFGRHEGETILVCGTGPSLANCPESPSVTTLAVNRAIRHVKADYWCFQDLDVWEFCKDIHKPPTDIVCIAQCHEKIGNTPAYLADADMCPNRWRKPEMRPLYGNNLTLSWVIHLAVKMGAKKIVTIGCDLAPTGQWDGFLQPDHTKDWQRGQHLLCLDKVRKMFRHDGEQWFERMVEIVDASGGNMPVKQVRLEEALA